MVLPHGQARTPQPRCRPAPAAQSTARLGRLGTRGDWAIEGADPSWKSGAALARLLLGAGYFRAARGEDRGRPVEAGKRRDEGSRALWLAHRVRKRRGRGSESMDRCERLRVAARSAGRCSGRIPDSVLPQAGAPIDSPGEKWAAQDEMGTPRMSNHPKKG